MYGTEQRDGAKIPLVTSQSQSNKITFAPFFSARVSPQLVVLKKTYIRRTKNVVYLCKVLVGFCTNLPWVNQKNSQVKSLSQKTCNIPHLGFFLSSN